MALHYLYKLQETKFPFAFVYKLYCDENAEHTLDSEALLQLQQSTATTPLMQHARIHFAEEIGLNVQERNQIAAGLTQKNTEELYFAACEKEVVSGKEEAYNKYLKAFNAGSRQAGDWLANYYITKQNNSSHDMKRLADALIPSAAFEYGKDCLQNNRYAQGVTYLRIACTKRFVPAITYYADLLYQEILQNKDKAETIEKKAQNAISLYQFLLDNHINETAPAAKLGVLYYQQQNIERAKYFLEQDTSLPEAKYCMGCMYAEGTYVAQDDDKANTYLKEALKAGYSKADAPLQQIKKRKQKKQASKQTQRQKKTSSQQYKEHADYSSKSTLTSSDEGCFITTATCTAMNKPDDCEELTAFRRFRDDVLLSTPEGKLLVKEYYRIAPSIVDCISREADAADCYQKLYRDYILPGYCALAHGDTHTAVQLYSRMVESLAKKYFIE